RRALPFRLHEIAKLRRIPEQPLGHGVVGAREVADDIGIEGAGRHGDRLATHHLVAILPGLVALRLDKRNAVADLQWPESSDGLGALLRPAAFGRPECRILPRLVAVR